MSGRTWNELLHAGRIRAGLALVLLAGVLLGGMLAAERASAQTSTLRIETGDLIPDPVDTPVAVQGATIPAAGDCAGYVADAPTLTLRYDAPTTAGPLYLTVTSSTDTVLLVTLPDGTTACDDDGGLNHNPALAIAQPAAGTYRIWVGTYEASTAAKGVLRFSRAAPTPHDTPTTVSRPVAAEPAAPDPTRAARSGRLALTSPFLPDPTEHSVQAGGRHPLALDGVTCPGYTSAAPSFELAYTAGDYVLYLSTYAPPGHALLVQDPTGSWHCGSGRRPLLRFDQPISGSYRVWLLAPEPETDDEMLVISERVPD